MPHGNTRSSHTLAFVALLPVVGAQQFAELPQQALPDDPGTSILVDIDLDGDLDVVGVSAGSRGVLFINDGNGEFSDQSSRLPLRSELSTALAVGDVDGDRDLDLFIGNAFELNVLLLQQPDGAFALPAQPRLPLRFDGTQSAVLADVDGDLDLDLLLGDQQESTILLLNDGNGFYQDAAMSQLPRSFDNTQAVLAVDVDRDTDLDIIEVNLFGPDRLLLNDGFGIFTVDTSFPLDSDGTYGVAAGDIDGDRWVDLLFLNGLGANRLYRNMGNGQFVDESNRLPPNMSASFGGAMADVDEDGDLDLLIANSFAQDELRINDGRGFFTDATNRLPQAPNASSGVSVGDIDRDGDPDVLFTRFDGLLSNRLRHLEEVLPPVQGTDWNLLVSGSNGFATGSDTALVLLSLFETPVPIPTPFGDLLLQRPVVFATVGLAPVLGAGTALLPIPPTPSLVGVELYAQGVIAGPNSLRTTNRVRSAIR